ncbi:MAG: DNA-3-methyladenine glycosylase [Bacteroidota bacterium]|nr:DNA-3-methyladenine glycosylase [Bacteroidota bacterium]MDP4211308.1 DNA-3-methyladenine glycosylase [Bacteroidota bacterium]MDP4250003.1 DNA-3-methyladenine glycosylase [Bacteroidota bacterium]
MSGTMKKLDESFYDRNDVLKIARELLGKILVTRFDGVLTSGRIVETEAYAGEGDRACHAFGGRRTARTEAVYGPPGTIYIYICYGLHYLFNVVTNKKDIPHVVLIRALEPVKGIPVMLERTGKETPDYSLTRGPGNVSRALGMNKSHSGRNLLSGEIYIADDGFKYKKDQILVTKRIGVESAREDAERLYRFIVKGSPYVSAKKS